MNTPYYYQVKVTYPKCNVIKKFSCLQRILKRLSVNNAQTQ